MLAYGVGICFWAYAYMQAGEDTMKRIIDGVAYNTETSTKVAEMTFEADPNISGSTRGAVTVYQTRSGAFFKLDHEVIGYRDRDGEWQERVSNQCEAMTREEVLAWVAQQGDVEVFGNALDDVPEAMEAKEGEATIYTRVPASLKARADAQATAAGMSLNAFVIRCLEAGAAKVA